MPEWTFGSIKMGLSSILTTIVFLQLLNTTYAFSCNYNVGLTISIECPMAFQDQDKIFCCADSDTIPHCCNFGEFMRTNTAALAGIIVGVIVLLLIILICSCCCCSCCLLAKRRQQRGTVLYTPRL